MDKPVDFYKLDVMVEVFCTQVQELTGVKPDVEVWFHECDGDTRSLGHDAILCGYKPRQIHQWSARHRHSHISVHNKDESVKIVVPLRRKV